MPASSNPRNARPRRPSRRAAALLTGVFFFATVSSPFAEAGLWEDRRRSVQDDRSRDGSLMAHAPAAAQSLFQNLPPIRAARPEAEEVRRRAPGNVPADFRRKLEQVVGRVDGGHGTVRKISVPLRMTSSTPVVVHLQDVHMNAEAQSHLGKLTEGFIPRNGREPGAADLIALEGAFGAIDVGPYRRCADQRIVGMVADYLLKENGVSGPVHAAMTAPGVLPPLIGVDDRAHYDANVAGYVRSAPRLAEARAWIAGVRADLARRKEKEWNADLLKFDRASEGYEKGTVALGPYARELAARVPDRPAVFKSFLRALDLEDAMDFKAVEGERGRLLEALSARLSPAETKKLIEEGVAYRTGRLGHGAFYEYLKSFCAAKGIDFRRYPGMEKYVEYAVISDGLPAEDLFAILQELEGKAYDRLAGTPREKSLLADSRSARLTDKLIQFSLTTPEWRAYNARKTAGAFDLSSFEQFYKEAEARDAAMARNLEAALRRGRRSSSLVAVLVTGGFHGAGLERRLTAAGMAVVTVVPRLTRADPREGSNYLSVFMQEKTPLQKLFEGQKLFTAPNPIAGTEGRGQMLGAAAAALLYKHWEGAASYFHQALGGHGRVIVERLSDPSVVVRTIQDGLGWVDTSVTLGKNHILEASALGAGSSNGGHFNWADLLMISGLVGAVVAKKAAEPYLPILKRLEQILRARGGLWLIGAFFVSGLLAACGGGATAPNQKGGVAQIIANLPPNARDGRRADASMEARADGQDALSGSGGTPMTNAGTGGTGGATDMGSGGNGTGGAADTGSGGNGTGGATDTGSGGNGAGGAADTGSGGNGTGGVPGTGGATGSGGNGTGGMPGTGGATGSGGNGTGGMPGTGGATGSGGSVMDAAGGTGGQGPVMDGSSGADAGSDASLPAHTLDGRPITVVNEKTGQGLIGRTEGDIFVLEIWNDVHSDYPVKQQEIVMAGRVLVAGAPAGKNYGYSPDGAIFILTGAAKTNSSLPYADVTFRVLKPSDGSEIVLGTVGTGVKTVDDVSLNTGGGSAVIAWTNPGKELNSTKITWTPFGLVFAFMLPFLAGWGGGGLEGPAGWVAVLLPVVGALFLAYRWVQRARASKTASEALLEKARDAEAEEARKTSAGKAAAKALMDLVLPGPRPAAGPALVKYDGRRASLFGQVIGGMDLGIGGTTRGSVLAGVSSAALPTDEVGNDVAKYIEEEIASRGAASQLSDETRTLSALQGSLLETDDFAKARAAAVKQAKADDETLVDVVTVTDKDSVPRLLQGGGPIVLVAARKPVDGESPEKAKLELDRLKREIEELTKSSPHVVVGKNPILMTRDGGDKAPPILSLKQLDEDFEAARADKAFADLEGRKLRVNLILPLGLKLDDSELDPFSPIRQALVEIEGALSSMPLSLHEALQIQNAAEQIALIASNA